MKSVSPLKVICLMHCQTSAAEKILISPHQIKLCLMEQFANDLLQLWVA